MGDPELDGVVVFAPDGVMIGRIALPERCANLCFGGLKRNRLFMAASQSIYALYVNTQGAPGIGSRPARRTIPGLIKRADLRKTPGLWSLRAGRHAKRRSGYPPRRFVSRWLTRRCSRRPP